MADLRIYDFDFNLLCIEHKIISKSLSIYFNDIGKIEIHLAKNSKAKEVLFKNRYLLIETGGIKGIVTGIQIGKNCVIYAKTPNWILSKKVIMPFEKPGNIEVVLREQVSAVFEDTENFELGDLCGADDEKEFKPKRCVSLFDFVKGTLEEAGLGHRMDFDVRKKKWIFCVVKGKELPIVLSEGLLNCYDTEYMMDLQEYFTSGFYISDEDESYREYIKEEKSGVLKWEKALSSKTDEEAKEELSDYECEEKIETSIKKIEFGKDFNLGDEITLKFTSGDFRKTQGAKIIGINMWEEAGNKGKEVVLN